jgi:hypothetical protein
MKFSRIIFFWYIIDNRLVLFCSVGLRLAAQIGIILSGVREENCRGKASDSASAGALLCHRVD